MPIVRFARPITRIAARPAIRIRTPTGHTVKKKVAGQKPMLKKTLGRKTTGIKSNSKPVRSKPTSAKKAAGKKATAERGGGRIKVKTPALAKNLKTIKGFNNKNIKLTGDTISAYKKMIKAAKGETGISGNIFKLISGHRTQAHQDGLFKNAVKKYGNASEAKKWVARDSPHVTGKTIDMNLGIPNDSSNVSRQRNTEAYKWLKKNASRFGFYPYQREPWHWEYNPSKK